MKKLTKKEISQRESNFLDWNKSISSRIESLEDELSDSQRLNFSMDSLDYLEEFLLEKYADAKQEKVIEQEPFIESAATYLGELMIRNCEALVKWVPNLIHEKNEGKVNFLYFVCSEDGSNIREPGQLIFRTLKQRKSGFLKDKVTKIIDSITSESVSMKAENYGRGGCDYKHFILVLSPNFGLPDVEKILRKLCERRGDSSALKLIGDSRFTYNYSSDYYFHFYWNNEAYVEQESKMISQSYKGSALDKGAFAQAKSRVEFWGDGDPNGEYFNEHMFLLEQFLNDERVIIYNHIDGRIFGE